MPRTPRSSAWSFLRRPHLEEEVDTEFAFHVDMTMQTLVAQGMSAADARAEAVRRFGDIAVVAAECQRFGRQRDRTRSRAEYMSELKQDIAFALRGLRRARGFAITAIVTLALGIGATAAVFSALYAVVLSPLPFADAGRIVQFEVTRRNSPEDIFTGAEISALRARTDAFSYVAAVRMGAGFTLTGVDVPEVIGGMLVSADYFRVLGVSPRIGRSFVDADDHPGVPRVVIMSDRFWKSRFAGDPSIIGRTLRLDDEQYSVIGVMPADFDAFGPENKFWSPLRLSAEQLASHSGRSLSVIARVAPGVTLARASDAARAAVRLTAEHNPSASQDVSARARRYIDTIVGDYRQRLLVLLGAVGLVLLIACVNVANLLLARGTVRARELAIRAALGAGRSRLVRQLLAESLVLALGGAIVGVGVAFALVRVLVSLAPSGVPRLDHAGVNGVVLAFTFGVAIVSSVAVGLVPSLRSAGPALQTSLREGGRGSGGARRDPLRAFLVATEVALAMTLLTGSGLLIRTAIHLQQVNPGFKPANLMTARLLLPGARYRDPVLIAQAYDQIRSATLQVPGVQHAALVSVVPLTHNQLATSVAPDGRTLSADERISVDFRYASPDYFDTMGMPLVDGRDFARDDDASSMKVCIVSASLAKKLWPGERVVGKRLEVMSDKITVVGVSGDVHDAALNVPPSPTLYMPFQQMPAGMWVVTGRSLVLVTRTVPQPETLLNALKKAVASVDPSVPLTDEGSMSDILSSSMAKSRFNTMLLVTLAAIALILASIGVYGVVAYFVSQRTREIGVRMALGAAPADIWRLVLSRGLSPIVWGAVAGAALSLATARLLREQLFGVAPDDPATLLTVAALLLAVAVLATLTPARRAMRVMPSSALAAE
jgi:putative ABC transport system permease protein